MRISETWHKNKNENKEKCNSKDYHDCGNLDNSKNENDYSNNNKCPSISKKYQ